MKTQAEKEAAKAAKQAEKEAAKADISAEQKAVEQTAVASVMDVSWKSIANEYVFIKDPQTSKALNTANTFAAEPKVRTIIFPTSDEPDAKLYWGGINGFFFSVIVGVEVELPKSIAEHISKSRIANARAAQSLIVVNPFTGKPVQVNLDHVADETKRRLGIL